MKKDKSQNFQSITPDSNFVKEESSTYQPGDGGTIDVTNGNNAGSGGGDGDEAAAKSRNTPSSQPPKE